MLQPPVCVGSDATTAFSRPVKPEMEPRRPAANTTADADTLKPVAR
jgi:hypothetical protein